MVDENQPPESDLRRRAAWLLGMLAIVAVLFVVVISAVTGNGGSSGRTVQKGPLDAVISLTPQSSGGQSSGAGERSSSSPRSTSHSATGSTSAAARRSGCPTRATCVLDGDIGHGVAAVNDYRTSHGQSAVPGRVSQAAQDCAVHNGSGCSGGWAETELGKPSGAAAVQKILPFAHLLDANLKAFDVGWAYDPGAKLYYFAVIRND